MKTEEREALSSLQKAKKRKGRVVPFTLLTMIKKINEASKKHEKTPRAREERKEENIETFFFSLAHQNSVGYIFKSHSLDALNALPLPPGASPPPHTVRVVLFSSVSVDAPSGQVIFLFSRLV